MSGKNQPPKPSLRTIVKLAPAVLDDPVIVAKRLQERYGHLVKVPPIYPGMDGAVYLATHPDDVQLILQKKCSRFDDFENISASEFDDVMEGSLVGLGEDEEEWRWRRRHLSDSFTKQAVVDQADEIAAKAVSSFDELEGKPVSLLPAMQRLGIRVLTVSIFSEDVARREEDIIEAVSDLRSIFKSRHTTLRGMITKYVPVRRENETLPALRKLRTIAEGIVDRRIAAPDTYDDELTRWIDADDGLSREAAIAEVVGMTVAGYTTVGAGMTWAFYLLAQHPRWQEQIRQEARQSDFFDGGSVDDLEHAHRAWKEALRLYPSLPLFGREAIGPVELSGHQIDEGAKVLLSPYVTQRAPDVWDDPDEFKPDRFREDHHKCAFYPFSKGPKMCIGRNMALVEGTVVLATCFKDYRVRLCRDPDPGLDFAINLQPDADIRAKFVER